jgi:hypothetical protein
MFLLNGQPLSVGRAFTYMGIQYPANWLQLASEAEKAAISITWVADPVRADDRFYWDGDVNNPKMLDDREEVDEDGNPMWVKVLDNSDPDNPVMVDSTERLVTKGLKSNWTAQVKDTAGKLLAQTDWMVIRKAERDVAIPDNVVAFRQAVINKCSELETAIAAVTTVEELIALDYSFPTME